MGSIPAWCTPIPWRTSFDSVLPKPVAKRKSPMRVAIASRSAFVHNVRLSSDCARSSADAWVKWTT